MKTRKLLRLLLCMALACCALLWGLAACAVILGDETQSQSVGSEDTAGDSAGLSAGETDGGVLEPQSTPGPAGVVPNRIDSVEIPLSPPVTLAFTGDINLADTWENMLVYHAAENGIEDCISAPLLERMRDADILLVNNEFTFSGRGSPMEGKQYTFRAAPENVDILLEMGVDIVSLANNHVYDYGTDAFLDTLETLWAAGLPYVGAGKNLLEAMQPVYLTAGELTIAYVAASRAEKYIMTPEATEAAPGVLRCYDDALFLQAVADARQYADYVVAYPHWGTENTHVLEDVQVELAHKLIDAGADLVVGAHPHVLQGFEFYNGKPILYSLGNFWFNTARVDTALLEVTLHPEGGVKLRVQPCLQTGGKTSLLLEPTDRRALFDLLEGISTGVTIDDEGLVHPV